MKKIIAVAAALLVSAAAWSQVMSEPGVKNTLSVSFGNTYLENGSEYNSSDLRFFGFVDTVQTRIDINKCTIDAMLNWGALTNDEVVVGKFTDDFYFANTRITPFWYTNHYQGGSWWTNGEAESYYVNFIYHPHKYWDLGMGTRLEWKVGPAPSYNGNLWEPFCHIVQGGLKDAIPGQADVVGYTYYANSYTSYYYGGTDHYGTKAALGVRFHYEDFIEIGGALPSGVTSDKPVFNAGAKIHPADFLTISAGVDGLFRETGNLYGGVTVAFKAFILDAYLGIDYKENNKENGGRWGTGAALTFNFSKINLMLKPEAGFTFYTYADYTMATYGGLRINWQFADKFAFGGWSSLAFGSKNSKWEDDKATEDYWGGSIFDLRPDFTWTMDKHNSFTAFIDFQSRNNFAHKTLNTWATGVYWNYKSSK